MTLMARTQRVLLAKLATYMPEHSPLTEQEAGVLLRLQAAVRTIPRGNDVIVQGRKYDGVAILVEGFGLRYKVMADGKRQVFNVSLPGDLIGYPACFFDDALYSVTALTRVSFCFITFADVAEVFRSFPRLAMALFWSTASETAMLGEHLADVGRRSAYERVAHFILEMSARLSAVGLGDDSTFETPLTQAKIADVVGLSVPHISRMLRRLREEGFIEITGSRIRILDREELAALADFDESYLSRRPAPRAIPSFEDHPRQSRLGSNGHQVTVRDQVIVKDEGFARRTNVNG
jgi:CRP-like cAMP-binding protein